ncbi:MAG: hypothetical protein HKN44_06685 [Ilumatobacter sp.]|nr:hypothetical protein [Ilumatobacter sp.]
MSTVNSSGRRVVRRTAVATVIAVVVAVLVGCGTDDDATPATEVPDPPPTTVPTTTASTTTAAPPDTLPTTTAGTTPDTPPPAAAAVVRAYFHRHDEVIGPVARPVTGDPVATSRAALEALLAGPSDAERAIGFGSEIPAGTRLLGVRIDGGVSYVDLTAEFESGGGSSSMAMRLLQLVYTATQFDSVDAVRLLLDGVEVDIFSGEGLMVDHPLTRAEFDFDPQVPLILVEGPLPFETVRGDVRVHGTANVFEATVSLRITAADGEVLFDGFTTALCGSGCRGEFDVTIPVDVAGAATVTVFEVSSRDGSEINAVEIPVTRS